MANPYYTHNTDPNANVVALSQLIRTQLDLIEAGFALLPDFKANANSFLTVNSSETGFATITNNLINFKGDLRIDGDVTFVGAFPLTVVVPAAVTLTLPACTGTIATLLYHCDGDGSTTMTDSSANALNVTVPDGMSSAQKKFGDASAKFNSTTDILTADSVALGIGTNPWTIECWFRVDSTLNNPVQDRQAIWRWEGTISGNYSLETRDWSATSGASGTLRLRGNIPDPSITLDPNIILADAWYHVAMVRSIAGAIETVRFF